MNIKFSVVLLVKIFSSMSVSSNELANESNEHAIASENLGRSKAVMQSNNQKLQSKIRMGKKKKIHSKAKQKEDEKKQGAPDQSNRKKSPKANESRLLPQNEKYRIRSTPKYGLRKQEIDQEDDQVCQFADTFPSEVASPTTSSSSDSSSDEFIESDEFGNPCADTDFDGLPDCLFPPGGGNRKRMLRGMLRNLEENLESNFFEALKGQFPQFSDEIDKTLVESACSNLLNAETQCICRTRTIFWKVFQITNVTVSEEGVSFDAVADGHDEGGGQCNGCYPYTPNAQQSRRLFLRGQSNRILRCPSCSRRRHRELQIEKSAQDLVIECLEIFKNLDHDYFNDQLSFPCCSVLYQLENPLETFTSSAYGPGSLVSIGALEFPSAQPSQSPTPLPTFCPSDSPTDFSSPSDRPSQTPTKPTGPSFRPTKNPTPVPTPKPHPPQSKRPPSR